MASERAFVYVALGAAVHMLTLQRSLEYLRPRTRLPILVVTDTRRNEIAIDHSKVIDVKTPEHFDHHQASIFLKTSLNRILPRGPEYAYLDTDIIAVNEGVDLIFEHQHGPVTFGRDLTNLKNRVARFSPWAVCCDCIGDKGQECSHLTQAIEGKWGLRVGDDWVQWNGGVFVMGSDADPFMDLWHRLTMEIFVDPYWKTRDQGTLIATVWSLGAQKQECLPQQFNFIIDDHNPELRLDFEGNYSLHPSIPAIRPVFLHLYHEDLDRPDWNLGQDIEEALRAHTEAEFLKANVLVEKKSDLAVADRLARQFSPPLVLQNLLPLTDAIHQHGNSKGRIIVGRPRQSSNADSLFAETLVRSLKQRGFDAELLMTEMNTERIRDDNHTSRVARDIAHVELPVAKEARWGGRWGALVRYLEECSPCVYLPVMDLRNSIICPQLSERVAVVGIVRGIEPPQMDELERLYPYWNAVIVNHRDAATRLEQKLPGLAETGRIRLIALDDKAIETAHSEDEPEALRIIHGVTSDDTYASPMIVQGIIQGLLAQGIPLALTLTGGGRNLAALATALLQQAGAGAKFSLAVPGEWTPDLLDRHDVVLVTAATGWTPPIVLEAMARSCVPVVPDVAEFASLVQQGSNGYRTVEGDVEACCRVLNELWQAPGLLKSIGSQARATVAAQGLAVEELAASYAKFMESVLLDAARGGFKRPRGLLRTPPYQIDGYKVLPIAIRREIRNVGIFPSYREDYEDYRDALGVPLNAALPEWRSSLVRTHPVFIVASLSHSGPGTNDISTLAEALRAEGNLLYFLLSSEARGLAKSLLSDKNVRVIGAPGVNLLPRRCWTLMLSFWMKRMAPCVCLVDDSSSFQPFERQLPDHIGVVGRISAIDPQRLEQAALRARHWNAVVAGSTMTAERLLRIDPGLEPRLLTIMPSVEVPERMPARPLKWLAPLRLAHCLKGDSAGITPELNRLLSALAAREVPIELVPVDTGAEPDFFDRADALLVTAFEPDTEYRLLQAMSRGCVPVLATGYSTSIGFVRDRETGYVLPSEDWQGLADRLETLQDNPALRHAMSARAFDAAFERAIRGEAVTAAFKLLFERVLREVEFGNFRRSSALKPSNSHS